MAIFCVELFIGWCSLFLLAGMSSGSCLQKETEKNKLK